MPSKCYAQLLSRCRSFGASLALMACYSFCCSSSVRLKDVSFQFIFTYFQFLSRSLFSFFALDSSLPIWLWSCPLRTLCVDSLKPLYALHHWCLQTEGRLNGSKNPQIWLWQFGLSLLQQGVQMTRTKNHNELWNPLYFCCFVLMLRYLCPLSDVPPHSSPQTQCAQKLSHIEELANIKVYYEMSNLFWFLSIN